MNRLLLDTNAYAAFKQGHKEVLQILQHADLIGVSVIVLGELILGFSVGTKLQKNLEELNQFMSTPRIEIFPVDQNTSTFYATVYSSLRRKGKPIPTNDLWIAATALQQGCKLCTFDTHFTSVDNLIVSTTLASFLL